MKPGIKKLVTYLIALILALQPCIVFSDTDNESEIKKVESVLFGKPNTKLNLSDRISKIEKSLFGKVFGDGNDEIRLERIRNNPLGYYAIYGEFKNDESFNTEQTKNHYENIDTKEINKDEFINVFYDFVNEERTQRGFLPLSIDESAVNSSRKHANELISKDYISYYNFKRQCPDERYTLAGGTGAVTEIISSFEKDKNESKIKLNALLAKYLVEAIITNPDDSQVLFSPYLNFIGFGFATSRDLKKFVAVTDFIVKGGEFKLIKLTLQHGEKLKIEGNVVKPYKFKAVSIAYDEPNRNNLFSEDLNNTADIMPYFPPQDFIAYGDTKKINFLKVLKGIGVISAIGAAPFTGGASAILAPVLISSIQNGPPKEIPLKGGIKSSKNGEFTGEIELNSEGRPGLYYVSILGELPGVNFPIVISRRTVRVNSYLAPVSKMLDDKWKSL